MITQIRSRNFSQSTSVLGRVEAIERVHLRPRVSGYIDRVNYTEGQEVKKGDVLYQSTPATTVASWRRARRPNWHACAPRPN